MQNDYSSYTNSTKINVISVCVCAARMVISASLIAFSIASLGLWLVPATSSGKSE